MLRSLQARQTVHLVPRGASRLSVRWNPRSSSLKTISPVVRQGFPITAVRHYAQPPGGGGGGGMGGGGGFPGLSFGPSHQKGDALKEYVSHVFLGSGRAANGLCEERRPH